MVRRGTTAEVTMTLEGVATEDIENLYLSVVQGTLVIEKGIDELTVEDGDVTATLTEEETLALRANAWIEMQLTGRKADGTAFAGTITKDIVRPVLRADATATESTGTATDSEDSATESNTDDSGNTATDEEVEEMLGDVFN